MLCEGALACKECAGDGRVHPRERRWRRAVGRVRATPDLPKFHVYEPTQIQCAWLEARTKTNPTSQKHMPRCLFFPPCKRKRSPSANIICLRIIARVVSDARASLAADFQVLLQRSGRLPGSSRVVCRLRRAVRVQDLSRKCAMAPKARPFSSFRLVASVAARCGLAVGANGA